MTVLLGLLAGALKAEVAGRAVRTVWPWLLAAGVTAALVLAVALGGGSSRGGALLLASAQAPQQTAGGCPAAPGGPAEPIAGDRLEVAVRAAATAGFTGDDLVIAVAVASAESGLDPLATNVNTNGSVDHGLWQINSIHAALLRSGDWRDPLSNARMAYAVWTEAGGRWRPWVTFNEGLHVKHLEAGRAAAGAAGGDADTTLPVCTPEAEGGPVVIGSGQLMAPVAGRRSSPFGYRIHPISGVRKLHSGLDIAAPCGTPVVAADAGTVTQASWQGSYGNIIVVDHGPMDTGYAHLQGYAVKAGPVAKGQVIGYVGTTGGSTGCHLHLEVRNPQRVDPAPYL